MLKGARAMPQISVIIPVYQAHGFLRACTQAILGQTFQELELILVDDGSPDGSGELCDTIAAEDSRVRVIHQKNSGVSAARNAGMDAALGEYIAFCDADDTFEPDALKRLFNALTSSGADTSGCGHLNVWPDGHTQTEAGALPSGVYSHEELQSKVVAPLLGERLDFGQGVLNGFVWRFLFSKSIIQEHGVVFEGAYLEDELFLLEYFLYAQKLAMIDAPLYRYLQNPSSVTKNYLPNYLEVFQRFLERKRALVKRHNLDSLVPSWEDNSVWAGLLIAIGNEYAPGNAKSLREKSAFIKSLCQQPDMAHAIQTLHPKGLAGNKQLVADLVSGRHFTILSLLYHLKNQRK